MITKPKMITNCSLTFYVFIIIKCLLFYYHHDFMASIVYYCFGNLHIGQDFIEEIYNVEVSERWELLCFKVSQLICTMS